MGKAGRVEALDAEAPAEEDLDAIDRDISWAGIIVGWLFLCCAGACALAMAACVVFALLGSLHLLAPAAAFAFGAVFWSLLAWVAGAMARGLRESLAQQARIAETVRGLSSRIR